MAGIARVLRETGLGDGLFDGRTVTDVDFLGRAAEAEDFDFQGNSLLVGHHSCHEQHMAHFCLLTTYARMHSVPPISGSNHFLCLAYLDLYFVYLVRNSESPDGENGVLVGLAIKRRLRQQSDVDSLPVSAVVVRIHDEQLRWGYSVATPTGYRRSLKSRWLRWRVLHILHRTSTMASNNDSEKSLWTMLQEFAYEISGKSLHLRGPEILYGYCAWSRLRSQFSLKEQSIVDKFFAIVLMEARSRLSSRIQFKCTEVCDAWRSHEIGRAITALVDIHDVLDIPSIAFDIATFEKVTPYLREVADIEALLIDSLSTDRRRHVEILTSSIGWFRASGQVEVPRGFHNELSRIVPDDSGEFWQRVNLDRRLDAIAGTIHEGTNRGGTLDYRMRKLAYELEVLKHVLLAQKDLVDPEDHDKLLSYYLEEASLQGVLAFTVSLAAMTSIAWMDRFLTGVGHRGNVPILCSFAQPETDASSSWVMEISPLSTKARLHLVWPILSTCISTHDLQKHSTILLGSLQRLDVQLGQFPRIDVERLYKLAEAVMKAWPTDTQMPWIGIYTIMNDMRGATGEMAPNKLVVWLRRQYGEYGEQLVRQADRTGMQKVFVDTAVSVDELIEPDTIKEYYARTGCVFSSADLLNSDTLEDTTSSHTNRGPRHLELTKIENAVQPYDLSDAYEALRKGVVNWNEYEDFINAEAGIVARSFEASKGQINGNLRLSLEGMFPCKTIDYLIGRRVILVLTTRLDKRPSLARKIGYVKGTQGGGADPDIDGLKGYLRVLNLRDSDYKRPFESENVYKAEKVWLLTFRSVDT